MKSTIFYFLILISSICLGQELKIKKRSSRALSGTEFSNIIRDTTISIDEREKIIFKEFKSGNIPDFYRQLVEINDTSTIAKKEYIVKYYVLADYLALGNNNDYFYCPMRPQLAQKLARYLNCSLPTRKISNKIYENSIVKMEPQPIAPSKEMVRVSVFEKHNLMVHEQRKANFAQYSVGNLTAGNKKDVVISNKIINDKGKIRVVIYGWHKKDGKAIQPLYNGHSTIHVDYSHGIRLIQNKLWVNGKIRKMQKILKSKKMHVLLSDEGRIKKPYYPIKQTN